MLRWFRPIGPWFVPVSLMGWLISGLILAFCVQVFVFVDSRSHSVSDTFYGVFPFLMPSFLFWALIASRTSGSKD